MLLPIGALPWTSGESAQWTSPPSPHWLWTQGSLSPGGGKQIKILKLAISPPSPCQRPWAAGTWTSSGPCCSWSNLPQLTYICCLLPVVQGHICLGDQHWELVFPPFCLSRAPPNVFHRTGVFQKVSPLPPSRFRKSCQNDRRHLANKAINFHYRYPDCFWNITHF